MQELSGKLGSFLALTQPMFLIVFSRYKLENNN